MGLRENRLILKWALFFFNLLFWLLGITVFGVGIYVKTDHSDYATIMDEHSNGYSAILITVGVIVMVVGLAGCVGTLRENRKLLIVYATAVSLIFILECVAAGLGYQFREKLQNEVIKGMQRTLTIYDPQVNNDIRNSWRSVQAERECCGVQSFDDWVQNTTKWYETHIDTELPPSCCPTSPNTTCATNDLVHFNDTCYEVVLDNVSRHWKSLAGTAIGIALIQLVGIVLTAILSESVKRYGRYDQFD